MLKHIASVPAAYVCATAAIAAAAGAGGGAGEPVAEMVSAFEQRRNYVVERLRQIPGIKLAEPQV